MPLTLSSDNPGVTHWHVDASFAVHHDMRSHTGVTMSLGKGTVYSMSTRQQINTKSSTEAELVGVNDAMPSIVWTNNFLKGQGITVTDSIVYQDNQSAMLLETKGQKSSGKRSQHIDIQYFFIKDWIKNGELQIEYCSTEMIVLDVLTKALQGSQFWDKMLNVYESVPVHTSMSLQECVETLPPDSESNESKACKHVTFNKIIAETDGLHWIKVKNN